MSGLLRTLLLPLASYCLTFTLLSNKRQLLSNRLYRAILAKHTQYYITVSTKASPENHANADANANAAPLSTLEATRCKEEKLAVFEQAYCGINRRSLIRQAMS